MNGIQKQAVKLALHEPCCPGCGRNHLAVARWATAPILACMRCGWSGACVASFTGKYPRLVAHVTISAPSAPSRRIP